MALVGNSNEQKIWNYLKIKGLNNYACAGLMGMSTATRVMLTLSRQLPTNTV